METKLKIKGTWSELKSKLQMKYPKLTDKDLIFAAGKEDDLVERISTRLNKTEEEVNDIINDMQSEKSKTSPEKEIKKK